VRGDYLPPLWPLGCLTFLAGIGIVAIIVWAIDLLELLT
jgi:hypothetical protein